MKKIIDSLSFYVYLRLAGVSLLSDASNSSTKGSQSVTSSKIYSCLLVSSANLFHQQTLKLSELPIWLIVFDEPESIVHVVQGLSLSTTSLVSTWVTDRHKDTYIDIRTC